MGDRNGILKPSEIMAAKTKKQSLKPLLYFGGGSVEWVPRPGNEDNGYRRDETLSRSPQDMVRVARGLARESGVKPGKCLVLLGGEAVRQRVYSLGEIPSKELGAVMRRKAANLLEVEEHQVVFSAIPLASHDGENEHRWLVSAIRLDEIRSLQRHLIRDGFKPKRFLFARQSMLRTAESYLSTGSEDEAWVIVGVEEKGVAISLVAAGSLVQQSVVPGKFDAQSAMAASVLQEMRGFESYWRRFSRGGAIDDVFVAGLTEEAGDHFQLACHAALPNSEFLSVGAGEGGTEEDARAAYLSTCAAGEGVEGDLTLAAPVGRKWMVTTACLTLILGVMVGNGLQKKLNRLANQRLERVSSLSSKVPNLAEIERDLDRFQRGMEEMEIRGKIAAEVGTAGLDLGSWLHYTRSSFEGRAVLESLHLDDTHGNSSFAATGRVSDDPTESTLALASVSEALQALPDMSLFRLRLPSALGSTSTGQAGLEFRMTGSLFTHSLMGPSMGIEGGPDQEIIQ